MLESGGVEKRGGERRVEGKGGVWEGEMGEGVRTNAWPLGPPLGQLIMPHWFEAWSIGRERCGGVLVVLVVVGRDVMSGNSRSDWRRTRSWRRRGGRWLVWRYMV